MRLSSPLIKVLVLLGILGGVLLVVQYQKTTTGPVINQLLPTPTPTASPIQESEVHSPDGTMKLIMQAQKNNDKSNNYSFFMADITGKWERPLFTKTIESTGTMALPRNSFSPDNKYVYLEESEGNLLNALVFKASGEPFANGQAFLDVAAHLVQSKPGYQLTHVTGWASPQLLQMDTLTERLTKGPSYWFDVASRAFLLH